MAEAWRKAWQGEGHKFPSAGTEDKRLIKINNIQPFERLITEHSGHSLTSVCDCHSRLSTGGLLVCPPPLPIFSLDLCSWRRFHISPVSNKIQTNFFCVETVKRLLSGSYDNKRPHQFVHWTHSMQTSILLGELKFELTAFSALELFQDRENPRLNYCQISWRQLQSGRFIRTRDLFLSVTWLLNIDRECIRSATSPLAMSFSILIKLSGEINIKLENAKLHKSK